MKPSSYRLRHGTRCRCLWGNDSKFGQSEPEVISSLCFGRVVLISDISKIGVRERGSERASKWEGWRLKHQISESKGTNNPEISTLSSPMSSCQPVVRVRPRPSFARRHGVMTFWPDCPRSCAAPLQHTVVASEFATLIGEVGNREFPISLSPGTVCAGVGLGKGTL